MDLDHRAIGSNIWTDKTRHTAILGRLLPCELHRFQVCTSSHTVNALIQYQLRARDPRRNKGLVDWILALPLDFNSDSAFASKDIVFFRIERHSD